MPKETYYPPEIQETDNPVIFLAGPIQDAPDWQSEAISIVHSLDEEIAVACPRKNYEEGEFVYEKQVDWETHFLRRAADWGAIMFWLAAQTGQTDDRTYAQTSRFELGEWKTISQIRRMNLVVGIETGFGNERYIRRRFSQDCPDVPILSNLPDTCEATVGLIR